MGQWATVARRYCSGAATVGCSTPRVSSLFKERLGSHQGYAENRLDLVPIIPALGVRPPPLRGRAPWVQGHPDPDP